MSLPRFAFAGLSLLSFASLALAQQYNFTNLGAASGVQAVSRAYGINNSGVISGGGGSTSTNGVAGYWTSPTAFISIGVPNGYDGAFAINNSDAIAAFSSGLVSSPYYWSSSSGLVSLGHPAGNSDDSALGLNDAGQVVGGGPEGSTDKPWVWSSAGGFQMLDCPASEGYGYAINASGKIVGSIGSAMTIWDSPTSAAQTFGGGAAYAINSSGAITGFLGGSGNDSAFYRAPDGTMTTIAATGGFNNIDGYAINNAGVVVGGEYTSSGSYASVIWTASGGTRDLSTLLLPGQASGWTLEFADGINDSGQIVGTALDPGGTERAFLLTPVPEPATIVCVATGLFAVVRRRRKA